MVGSILIGLVLWFLASIPLGVVVGRMLARSNEALDTAPSLSMAVTDTHPTRPAGLIGQSGYASPITPLRRD